MRFANSYKVSVDCGCPNEILNYLPDLALNDQFREGLADKLRDELVRQDYQIIWKSSSKVEQ